MLLGIKQHLNSFTMYSVCLLQKKVAFYSFALAITESVKEIQGDSVLLPKLLSGKQKN